MTKTIKGSVFNIFTINPFHLLSASFLILCRPHLLHITQKTKSMAVQLGNSGDVIFPHEKPPKARHTFRILIECPPCKFDVTSAHEELADSWSFVDNTLGSQWIIRKTSHWVSFYRDYIFILSQNIRLKKTMINFQHLDKYQSYKITLWTGWNLFNCWTKFLCGVVSTSPYYAFLFLCVLRIRLLRFNSNYQANVEVYCFVHLLLCLFTKYLLNSRFPSSCVPGKTRSRVELRVRQWLQILFCNQVTMWSCVRRESAPHLKFFTYIMDWNLYITITRWSRSINEISTYKSMLTLMITQISEGKRANQKNCKNVEGIRELKWSLDR